jgi:hypothetical protein
MPPPDIAHQRLQAQRIDPPAFEGPADVVRWFGAVQAQDYLGALWAVGLRTANATERSVEQALADRTILRTWPLRGTLHFVAAEDARWMLELMAPRIVARTARRDAELGLDEATFARSRKLFIPLLRDGRQLSRAAMYQALEAAKISTAGQRGIHILWRLAQEGLICFGAREGKQQTFALLEEWAPGARKLQRSEALGEAARRYFTAHGPATIPDLSWWSGLPISEARAALELVKSQLSSETIDGQTYWRSAQPLPGAKAGSGAQLLPAFDEYLVGYRDRTAVLADKLAVNAGGGMLAPTMVIDGRVAGTWKRTLKKVGVTIALSPFGSLSKRERQGLAAPAERFGRFLGKPASFAD